MKTRIFLSVFIFLLSISVQAQDKKITGVIFTEDSKLLISVEAESITDVTFSISTSENVDNETIGYKFPISLEINPLNKKAFHDNFLKKLKDLALYQLEPELLSTNLDELQKKLQDTIGANKAHANTRLEYLVKILDKLFTDEHKTTFFGGSQKFQEKVDKIRVSLKSPDKLTQLKKVMPTLVNDNIFSSLDDKILGDFKSLMLKPNSIEFFNAKRNIDEILNNLYRFFDGQLLLLFQFDTEPTAGNLYFNKLISGVQFYTDDWDELKLKKRVLDYHKLIRQLHKVQEKGFKHIVKGKTNPSNNELLEKNKSKQSPNTLKRSTNSLNYPRLWKKCIDCNIDSIYIKKYFINEAYRKDSIIEVIDKSVSQLKEIINQLYQRKVGDSSDAILSYNRNLYREGLFLDNLNSSIVKFNLENNFEKEISSLISYDYVTKYYENESNLFPNSFRDSIVQKEMQREKDYLSKIKFAIEKLFAKDNAQSKENKEDLTLTKLKKETAKITKEFNKDSLLKYYVCVIQNHFKQSKGKNRKFQNDPKSFYLKFKNIVDNFDEIYWGERNRQIKNRLLNLRNEDAYESLDYSLKDYEGVAKSKRELALKVEFLKTQLDLFDTINEIVTSKRISMAPLEENRFDQLDELNKRYSDLTDNNDVFYSFSKLRSFLIDDSNYLKINSISSRDMTKKENMKLIEKFEKLEEELKSKEREIADLNGRKFDNEVLKIRKISNEINDEKFTKVYELERLSPNNRRLYAFYQENRYNGFREKTSKLIRSYRDSLNNGLQQKNALQQIKKELKQALLWDFEAKSIDLDFNDGFLERVVIEAEIKGPSAVDNTDKGVNEKLVELIKENKDWDTHYGKKYKFTSHFPYGFSSQIDYEDIKAYELSVIKGRKKQFIMQMEDVFPEYLQRLANNRLDFSPKNQSIKIDIGSEHTNSNNRLQLKKEVSSKLFNIKVFTDFIGFGSDPNGVAQFEFDRIIPLHTKRKPVGPRRFLRRTFGPSFNWGYVNYMRPEFRWSRLNTAEDSENLVVSSVPTFVNGTSESVSFVTLLDMLRYENISVGADLNLFMFDYPNSKFRTEINAGARFGRTRVLNGAPVVDESQTETPIDSNGFSNTWRFYPEVLFRLRPEERYGAAISTRYMRYNTQTTDFSVVSSAEQFQEDFTDDPQWLWQFAIDAHYSPSATNDNKFFFRYRYTNNSSFDTNGFSELQLGYVISLRPRGRD